MSEQTYSADIKELGDKIVALTVGKAVELGDYLENVHGIKPASGGAVMLPPPQVVQARVQKLLQSRLSSLLFSTAYPKPPRRLA